MTYGRFRSRSHGTHYGRITHLPSGTVEVTTTSLGVSNCTDLSGDRLNPHPLDIFHEDRIPGLITGQAQAFPVYKYESAAMVGQPTFSGHLGDPTALPSPTEAVTKAASRRNPSGANIDMPVFLLELRELPGMLKHAFEASTDTAARASKRQLRKDPHDTDNSVLETNFGWLTLYQDVATLFNFSKHVDDRMKVLKVLAKKGWSSSGRVRTGGYHQRAISEEMVFHSIEAYVTGHYQTDTVCKRWGSARFYVDNPPDFVSDASAQRQLAKEVVHGWRISPATVWQALPWTWLSDYFVNVGDFLDATRNTIGVSVGTGCCMTETTTVIQQVITSAPPWFTVQPGRLTVQTKERVLANVGLSTNTNALSPSRLVNLLGLASQYKGK